MNPHLRTQVLSVIVGLTLIGVVFDLVRRRKLKEEYSLLWIIAGVVVLVFAIWYDLLLAITRLIGAVAAPSTIFFLGVIFLALISLHFSVRISVLSGQVKTLVQEFTLLKDRIEETSKERTEKSG